MNSQTHLPSQDVARTTLAVLFIAGLLIATGSIVRPFVSAFLWATMIVVSTWPFFLSLQARLWGKRSLATAAMTCALVLILIVPFVLLVVGLVGNIDTIVGWVRASHELKLPPLPDWVAGVPLVGPRVSAKWQHIASEGFNSVAAQIQPYAVRLLQWFTAQLGEVGAMILQFLLTIIISAILYTNGEKMAQGVRRFARRLGGESGEKVAVLAAGSIRGVAMGVIVTAIIQALLAGLGLTILGVPAALILTALVFILCLAQIGPLLVMLPVVVWAYHSGNPVRGTILLVLAVLVGTMDNFIRPVLIRKGASLPLLLILSGVIGGLIALGIAGIFVGPVVLAVSYTLLKDWVEKEPADTAAPGATATADLPSQGEKAVVRVA